MRRQRSGQEELWAAIGDPSRRKLLDVLLALGEASPSALARELPFTRQAVVKHLAVLDRVGLVQARRHGGQLRYTVRPEQVASAARALEEAAARWDERLQAIKQLAEAAHHAENPPGPSPTEGPAPRDDASP